MNPFNDIITNSVATSTELMVSIVSKQFPPIFAVLAGLLGLLVIFYVFTRLIFGWSKW